MKVNQCEREATHDSHEGEGDVSDVGEDRDELESKTNGTDKTLDLDPERDCRKRGMSVESCGMAGWETYQGCEASWGTDHVSQNRFNTKGEDNVLKGPQEKLEEHVDVLTPGILVLAWLGAVSKRDLHVLKRDENIVSILLLGTRQRG